jgi:YbgC/YbaW family acyl-CoA thioester hydrolase
MTGAVNRIDIKVRWSEADAAGIAFYPRFFEWFDMATEALFESLEMPWPVLFPRYRVVGVPIVDVGARFASPVRYGDMVTVRASISEVREKTFRVDHEVSVGERHCASGFEVRAWVAQPDEPGGELHAKPLPIEIVTKLKGEGGVYA